MEIVNVKVKFIRPKYDNLEEWMNDKNNIYIGRKGIVFINGERFPKKDSIFANPFKICKDGDRYVVLKKYEEYINNKIKNDENFKLELLKLKTLKSENKKILLGCWCKPEICHGDILIKIIDKLNDSVV